jgi:monofunctional biosynthetic peptidoglycan transglycosylase
MKRRGAAAGRSGRRFVALLLLTFAALQVFFVLRVLVMAVVDPASTTFQRSEAWRIVTTKGALPWRETWLDADRISPNLKRAVIASEDAGFVEHGGIEWDAIEKAWGRNQRSEASTDKARSRDAQRASRAASNRAAPEPRKREAKVVGGSTITQQLAKNLLLSGERDLPRKAQEALITYALEAFLGKQRILELYLNHVEWGEGIFGADAAAHHYFHLGAGQLSAQQAAQLAVMLPAPKRFEQRPSSPFVIGRAATVLARMGAVELP